MLRSILSRRTVLFLFPAGLIFLSGAVTTASAQPWTTTATITSSMSGSSLSGTAILGADVTVTITVSAAAGGFPPLGNVQIRDGVTVLGSALPDSPGTSGSDTRNYIFTINASQIAAVGNHDLTAAYTSGSSNFVNHTSAIFPLNISPMITASITPASPSYFGQTLLLPGVTLTNPPAGPNPTGNVSVYETTSGSDVGIAGCTNVAAASISNCNLGFGAIGTHTYRIDFLGDANYDPSSLALTQVVEPAVTTATIVSSTSGASPSGSAFYGADVTLTMTVSAGSGGFPPLGSLQVRDFTTVLGNAIPDSPGTSGTNTRNYTITISAAQITACGTHNLTAIYASGNGNFAGHTSAVFPLTVTGCPPGSCLITPVAGCDSVANKSRLFLKDKDDDEVDTCVFEFKKGSLPVAGSDFGDPTASTWVSLCIYDGTGLLVTEYAVPPGATNWSTTSDRGFNYRDASRAADGVKAVELRGGKTDDPQSPKVTLTAKGPSAPDPAIPLALPVTVQVVNSSTAACFEQTYSSALLNIDKGHVRKFEGRN